MMMSHPGDATKVYEVQCDACHKPFHLKPAADADKNAKGEIDVVVQCQYCETYLVVTLPRADAGAEVIMRGSTRRKESE